MSVPPLWPPFAQRRTRRAPFMCISIFLSPVRCQCRKRRSLPPTQSVQIMGAFLLRRLLDTTCAVGIIYEHACNGPRSCLGTHDEAARRTKIQRTPPEGNTHLIALASAPPSHDGVARRRHKQEDSMIKPNRRQTLALGGATIR